MAPHFCLQRHESPQPGSCNESFFFVLHRILATSFSIIHPSTLPSGIFLFYKCLSCYSLRQLNLKFAILGNLLFLMLSSLNSEFVVWNRLQSGFLLPTWISGGLPFPGLLWIYFSASHWWLPRVSSNHFSHWIPLVSTIPSLSWMPWSDPLWWELRGLTVPKTSLYW